MKPKKPAEPEYVYMIIYGNKVQAYPMGKATNERTVPNEDMVGSMCLPAEDWAVREKYIIDLESYLEGN